MDAAMERGCRRLPTVEQFLRQVRSLGGAWRAHYTPKLKNRTALLRKLKAMSGRNQSQPVGRAVKLINPVLRSWAGWLPHAKYASWGCLGLTRGDRR